MPAVFTVAVGLLATFATGTIAWIAWILIFIPGDAMGPNAFLLGVPTLAVVSGLLVGHYGGRVVRWTASLLALPALAFWVFVPDGWWAVPPPMTAQVEVPVAQTPPTPPEAACAALRDWFDREIAGDAVDRQAQVAVAACLASGALIGKRREDIDAILGPGRPATVFSPSFGFQQTDRYWAVGRLPANMVGGVPNLVVRFDAADRCVEAVPVHTQ